MIRVIIADDHPMARAGLEQLLAQTSDIEVVAVADCGEKAVILDAEHTPDVVLMDISMPGVGGIESTRQICANRPDARVVMLSAFTDQDRILSALDAGAIGYLVKDADTSTLVEGIRACATGGSPLDPRAGRALLDKRRNAARPRITARETEILTLVSKGLSNTSISRQLGISEKTVKVHLTKVYALIGVFDRTQAALWARQNLVEFTG